MIALIHYHRVAMLDRGAAAYPRLMALCWRSAGIPTDLLQPVVAWGAGLRLQE